MLASLTKPRRLHFLNLDHGPITIKDPIHLAISALGPKTRALPEKYGAQRTVYGHIFGNDRALSRNYTNS